MRFPVGEVASLGAALCWAVGLTLYRPRVVELGARPVNFFKAVLGTALFLACMAVAGSRPIPPAAQAALALSGIVGLALGDTLLFHALGLLGPHRAALFGCLGPVFTALGAWLLLAESLSASQVAGVLLATGGLAMVVYFRGGSGSQGPGVTGKGVALGVSSALCQAGGVLLAKYGLEEADALGATAVRLAAATAALALYALLKRDLLPDLRRVWRPRTAFRLVPAVLTGTFGGLWLMQLGIKHAESAVANALHSTTPLFTLPIALLFLRERLGLLAILGSFVAVGGVVLLLAFAG